MSNTKTSETNILERRQENRDQYSPTIRLKLALTDPTEDSCSIFDVPRLISKEKKKLRKENTNKIALDNGDHNLKDDEDVKKLAKLYDEKYGGDYSGKKKKKPTFYNYSALASGYDESDSFIDNTDYYDEEVPEEMDTFHGGYYVNCGLLEFKKVDSEDSDNEGGDIFNMKKDSNLQKPNNVVVSDESDDEQLNNDSAVIEEESEESSINEEKELEVSSAPQVVKTEPLTTDDNKQVLSPQIQYPSECQINNVENAMIKEEEIGIQDGGNILCEKEGVYIKKKIQKKRNAEELEFNDESKPKKKKAVTVKSMLQEKRIGEVFTVAPISSGEIDREIQNVDRSADNNSISSSGPSSTSSVVAKEYPVLPNNLSSDLLELIDEIKSMAACHNMDLGARSFFDSKINSKLLKLEVKTCSLSSSVKRAIYKNLSFHVPCSTETLMKRAKNLIVTEEDKKIAEPFRKLQLSIEVIMPSVIRKYTAECQKVADEKNIGDFGQSQALKDIKKQVSSKLPQKKFPWTDELRGYLQDMVNVRLKCFFYLKPRKESPQEYVEQFFSSKVKPLWPQGWMKTSTLMKESHFENLLMKIKKDVSLQSKHYNVDILNKIPNNLVPNLVNSSNNNNLIIPSMPPSSTCSSAYNLVNSQLALAALQYSTSMSDKNLLYQSSTTSSNNISRSNKNDLTLPSAVSSVVSPLPVDLLRLATLAQSTAAATLVQSSTGNNHTYAKSNKKQTPSPRQSPSILSSSHQIVIPSTSPQLLPVSSPHPVVVPSSYDRVTASSPFDKTDNNLISQSNKSYLSQQQPLKKQQRYNVAAENMEPLIKPSSACEEVLDLSPNKSSKSDTSDTSSEHNDEFMKLNRNTNESVSRVHNKKTKDEHLVLNQSQKIEKPPQQFQKIEKLPLQSQQLSFQKEICNSNSKMPVSRKQRLLQDSALYAATQVVNTTSINQNSSCFSTLPKSTTVHCSSNRSYIVHKPEDKVTVLPTFEPEKKVIEETTTATDLLSQIINDTLQDNSTPLEPQFTNKLNFDKNYGKQEIIIDDFEAVLEKRHLVKIDKLPTKNQQQQSLAPPQQQNLSSSYFNNKPQENNADMDAAELIIKDLLVLNEMGNTNNRAKLPAYAEKSHNSAVSSSSNLYPSNSMNKQGSGGTRKSATPPYLQSSLNVTSTDSGNGIPRMNISGFQSEFFKHIYKMEHNKHDPFSFALKNQEAKNDFTGIENGRTMTLNYGKPASTTSSSANTSYPYQQNVVMPSSSNNKPKLWHPPDSQS